MQLRSASARQSPVLADWMLCQEIARHYGRSFYLASRLLPSARQRGVIATYAFCRIADDIVDRAVAGGPDATEQALAHWEAQLDEPTHPVAIAFAATRRRFDVPIEPVRDLLFGVRMDLTKSRYATWDELRAYCYHVAGTVGLMVAPILGCQDPGALRHAADLGIAMQLTNILRDVGEDAELDRLYLPLAEIEVYGCDPEAILAGQPDGDFRELMAFQVDRARVLYTSAFEGVNALAPSGRFATVTAANLYSGILCEIEALGFDVFGTRAFVPTSRKLRAVARASASVAWMSASPQNWLSRSDGTETAAAEPELRTSAPVKAGTGRTRFR